MTNMNRAEWAFIVILTALSLLALASAPMLAPLTLAQNAGEAVAITVTQTEMPTWTSAPTPTPSSTSSPSPTATETMTPSPSATPTPTVTASPTASPSPTRTLLPFDPRASVARYIYIDQARQRMYILEKGKLIREMACSTGLPDARTITPAWQGKVGYFVGTFFAFDVFADDAWYLFEHDGAILIHSLPYTIVQGRKVYQDADALGVRPVSHGCIRISPADAIWLTGWNPEGAEIAISELPPS